MSAAQNSTPTPPARVHEGTFMGVMWGGTAVALIFFAGRVAVRFKAFRRFYADDAMVLTACLFLMINTLIWQFSKDDLYETIAAASGQLYPPPSDLPQHARTYLMRSVAVIALFYSGLWAIKLSFMLFFWRLGRNVRNQKLLWWAILATIVATWCACIGTIQYRCLTGSFEYIETVCNGSSSIAFQRNTMRWNMIMDVITDALIIVVPVNLLWKVQISLRKRLALAVVFSLTIIIMVVAVIRVVVVSSFSHQLDQTWLYMWSSVEQTVSILVACLGSFRALFSKSNRSSHERIRNEKPKPVKSSAPRLGLLHGSRFTVGSLFDQFSKTVNDITEEEALSRVPSSQTVVSASKQDHWNEHLKHSSDYGKHIVPLDKVHVAHENPIV